MPSYFQIIKLVLPLALGMVNNAVMQFIDRAFLARESMTSLESVMPSSMLSLIVLCFFQGVVAYSGTYVANFHGAGDVPMERLSRRVGILIAVVSGILTLAFLPMGEIVLRAFSLGGEVADKGIAYFEICILGGIFLYLQMAEQSYFTGLGKTRVVFVVCLVGNLANIFLDWVFIFGKLGFPKFGIEGAALATVSSLAIQWVILLSLSCRHFRLSPEEKKLRLRDNWSLLKGMLRFGIPAGGYNILNLSSFTIFVFFAGRVGHLEAAVSNACFAVNYLLFAPIEGFALGAQTLVAQLKGSRRIKAARRAGLMTVVLSIAFTTIMLAFTLIFYRPILECFAPAEIAQKNAFITLGRTLLWLMAAWQIFEVLDTVLCGALKGAGDTKFVLWWMLFVSFIVWIPTVAVVSIVKNEMPVLWATMIISVALLAAGSLTRWLASSWVRIRIA